MFIDLCCNGSIENFEFSGPSSNLGRSVFKEGEDMNMFRRINSNSLSRCFSRGYYEFVEAKKIYCGSTCWSRHGRCFSESIDSACSYIGRNLRSYSPCSSRFAREIRFNWIASQDFARSFARDGTTYTLPA